MSLSAILEVLGLQGSGKYSVVFNIELTTADIAAGYAVPQIVGEETVHVSIKSKLSTGDQDKVKAGTVIQVLRNIDSSGLTNAEAKALLLAEHADITTKTLGRMRHGFTFAGLSYDGTSWSI